MVAPAILKRYTITTDLQRGLDRAAAEKIVVFKRGAWTLGVATVVGGTFIVKPYTITIVGAGPGDVTCNCAAGSNLRICKHLSAGIFARKHHVYAKVPAPATSTRIECPTALDELFS